MLRPSGNDYDMRLRADGTGGSSYLSVYSGGDLVNPRTVVTASGNVGIGTTNPTAKLQVSGTAGTDGIRFPDGSLQVRSAGVKAWVVFDGDTAPYPIRDSNNVASVAYEGGGIYKINWITPFADTNYAFFVTTSAGPIRLTEINAAYLRFQVFSISSSPAAAVADYISVVAVDN